MGLIYFGRVTASASGANGSLNLANLAIGAIGANASGPLGLIGNARNGSPHSVTVQVVNNGSASAFWAPPSEVPDIGALSAAPDSGLEIPAGETREFEGQDLTTWAWILWLLDGADVVVRVWYRGSGYRRVEA